MPWSQAALGDGKCAGREQQCGCGVSISPAWGSCSAWPSPAPRAGAKPLLSLCIAQVTLEHHRAPGRVGNLLLK